MKKTPELFDEANEEIKKREFSKKKPPQVKIGQFWWYYEGINPGQELSKNGKGRRPCQILKIIPSTTLLLVAPLTTQYKEKTKESLIELHNHRKYKLRRSRFLLHQIKIIDKRRLLHETSNENYNAKNISKYILQKVCDFFQNKNKP